MSFYEYSTSQQRDARERARNAQSWRDVKALDTANELALRRALFETSQQWRVAAELEKRRADKWRHKIIDLLGLYGKKSSGELERMFSQLTLVLNEHERL